MLFAVAVPLVTPPPTQPPIFDVDATVEFTVGFDDVIIGNAGVYVCLPVSVLHCVGRRCRGPGGTGGHHARPVRAMTTRTTILQPYAFELPL